jgi:predicted nuclease with TOPRIM domain
MNTSTPKPMQKGSETFFGGLSRAEMAEKLRHYASLNNTLCLRNTELEVANRERDDCLSRVIKENALLKEDLDRQMVALEKVKEELSEAESEVESDKEFIENLENINAQKKLKVRELKKKFEYAEHNHEIKLSLVAHDTAELEYKMQGLKNKLN